MEELKFTEYLRLCSEFEKDPQNEEKLNDITSFVSKVVVKEFIPLRKKEMLAMDIVTSLSPDFDAPSTAAFLEGGRVLKGLMSYCANLRNDVPLSTLYYFASDAIYQYGLYDHIIKYCESDYKRLVKIIDDVVNATNIYRITQTAAIFNEDSYQQWVKNMENLKDTLNSEQLKSLLELSMTDSKEGGDLLTQIAEAAIKQTNNEMKAESDKFNAAAEFREELEDKKAS